MDFFLCSFIFFSAIYALLCCVLSLCDRWCRGQVLYRLHK